MISHVSLSMIPILRYTITDFPYACISYSAVPLLYTIYQLVYSTESTLIIKHYNLAAVN